MNDDFARKVLSEARRSMSPTPEDRDAVLKRVMMSAAAATVAGSAAAAAKASGIGGLTALLLKGGALLKIGIAVTVAGGAVVTWLMLREQADESSRGRPAVVSVESAAPAEMTAIEPAPQAPESSAPEVPAIQANDELTDNSERAAKPIQAPDSPEKSAVKKRRPASPKDDAAESKPAHNDDDALYEEIAVMKKAAQALQSNQPGRALRILDTFDRSHPNGGVMGEERRGLRVLAFCAAGPPEKAAAAKKQFLAESPGSPMAARIRSACREVE